jgi:hypothetical protein
MNLSTLRDRVRSLTGIRLQDIRSDDQIDTVINESYQEIIESTNWPFLRSDASVSVVAGTEEFSTPAGYSEVTSVSYSDNLGNNVRLNQTTLDEIDLIDQDEEGDPVYYARINEDTFRLWPVPVTALTLNIRGKEVVASLSADSSTPIFAEQFHPLIAYRSASRILAEEGDDSGRSQFYQNEANNFFSRMLQFYTRNTDTRMFVMGSRRRRERINAYPRVYPSGF